MKNYIRQNISAVYITDANGVAVDADALDWLGVSLLTGDLPAPPELIKSLDDIILTVGDDPVVIELPENFSGATSFSVSPLNSGASLSGSSLTVLADAVRDVDFTVTATNSGGPISDTFSVLVEAVPVQKPTLVLAIPDQSLTVGDANAIIDLNDHFDGATSFTVSPVNSGASLSGSDLEISASTARDVSINVTATNAGGSVSDNFALSVIAESSNVVTSRTTDGEVVINGSGDVEWTITSPGEYAGGPYTTDESAEYSGKLNVEYTNSVAPQCIIVPKISRTVGSGDLVGATYRAVPALWQIADGDNATASGEWYLNGVSTGRNAANDYVASEAGEITCAWKITVAGKEERKSVSTAIQVTQLSSASKFIAPDGTKITDFSDSSGKTFSTFPQGGHKFEIHNNKLRKTWGSAAGYYVDRNEVLTPNQLAEVVIKAPASMAAPTDWLDVDIGPAVRTSGPTIDPSTDPESTNFYAAGFEVSATSSTLWLMKFSKFVNFKPNLISLGSAPVNIVSYAGKDVKVGIKAVGSVLTVLLDDVEVITGTDAEFTTGNAGVWARGSNSAASMSRDSGLVSFDARSL